MATASAGRADKGLSPSAPARSARPCSATASRSAAGGAGGKTDGPKEKVRSRSERKERYHEPRSRTRGLARERALRRRAGKGPPPPWKLDREGKHPKLCLKYRRAAGEILIVNHEGRGWWDPTSDAQGRRVQSRAAAGAGLELRPCAGSACASSQGSLRATHRLTTEVRERGPIGRSQTARRRSRPIRRGSAAWRDPRCSSGAGRPPPSRSPPTAGVLREGPHGSAWFAHRDETGAVCHVDVRGPTYKGSLKGARSACLC